MNENVRKFFELYNADPELQKRVRDAEAMYPGSLELREPLVEDVLLPVAKELGLPFSVKELQKYELEIFASRHRDVELGEDELAASAADEDEFWLINRGWSNDEARFCGDTQNQNSMIHIERRK